jgi:hypothetical protein
LQAQKRRTPAAPDVTPSLLSWTGPHCPRKRGVDEKGGGVNTKRDVAREVVDETAVGLATNLATKRTVRSINQVAIGNLTALI